MSINPFGHLLGPFGNYPANDVFLRAEYKGVYNQFFTNPSTENAKSLYDFLTTNKTELVQLVSQTGSGPLSNMTWDHVFSGLTTSLEGYIHGSSPTMLESALEWGNHYNMGMGIHYSSQEIVNNFFNMANLFLDSPTPSLAKGIEWMLSSPDYFNAVMNSASNSSSLGESAIEVEKCLGVYLANPTSSVFESDLKQSLLLLQQNI